MFKKILVLSVIGALAIFSGCQPNNQQTPNQTTPQNYQLRNATPPGTSVNNTVPPKQIDSIRTNVLSLMRDIDNKDWSKAKDKASTIKSDIAQLRTSLSRLGSTNLNNNARVNTAGTTGNDQNGNINKFMGNTNMSLKVPGTNNTIGGNPLNNNARNNVGNNGTIGNANGNIGATDTNIANMTKASNNLLKTISAKNSFEAKYTANQILKDVADISRSYTNSAPAELDRLTYLCNQIALNAEKRDWKSAQANCSSLKNTAADLRTKLNGKNNAEVKALDANIAKLNQSINSKNAANAAKYSKACQNNIEAIRK